MRRCSAELLRVLACAAIVAASVGCDERQGLLGPDAGATTGEASPVLPMDSVLRDGVVLRVGVRGNSGGRPLRVTALLVDSALRVAWRSAPVETAGPAALVPVDGLPAVTHGKRWRLTAFVEREGNRVYAHTDTAGATTMAAAFFREARVFAGTSHPVGGPVRGLVASAATAQAFFTVVGGGDVGVLDLASGRLAPPAATDRGEVWDLDVVGGTLAYLADAGSRVSFVKLHDAASDSAVLGPLEVLVTRTTMGEGGEVEVDSVEDVARPYATRLRLACAGADALCASPVAVLASPTRAGGSVVRLVAPSAPVPAVLISEHARMPESADTVAAAIRIAGPRRPGGEVETLLERVEVAGCASLRLGYAGFDISASGSLFSAGGDGCGPAGRVVRIDGALGARPALARLGLATMGAEDRIRSPVEVLAAGDGTRVLVREPDAVWLLDQDLRVLGFKGVSAGARVAWIEGAGRRFVVADGGRLDTFEADRFGLERTVAVGPLAGAPLVVVRVAGQGDVAVFVPGDDTSSIVTARVGGE